MPVPFVLYTDAVCRNSERRRRIAAMKKVLILAMTLAMLVTAVPALAEDVSGMADWELWELYEEVTAELAERNIVYGDTVLVFSNGAGSASGLTVEEYTSKAWPVTEEAYAELVNAAETREGQVYVIRGTVEDVNPEGLKRALIYAGEDGKSLPVIVTIPVLTTYSLSRGEHVRIYGEFDAPDDGTPVLDARYVFIETADAADAGQE